MAAFDTSHPQPTRAFTCKVNERKRPFFVIRNGLMASICGGKAGVHIALPNSHPRVQVLRSALSSIDLAPLGRCRLLRSGTCAAAAQGGNETKTFSKPQ